MHACMLAWMYVCMHVSMYVYTCKCIYTYIYTHTHTYIVLPQATPNPLFRKSANSVAHEPSCDLLH